MAKQVIMPKSKSIEKIPIPKKSKAGKIGTIAGTAIGAVIGGYLSAGAGTSAGASAGGAIGGALAGAAAGGAVGGATGGIVDENKGQKFEQHTTASGDPFVPVETPMDRRVAKKSNLQIFSEGLGALGAAPIDMQKEFLPPMLAAYQQQYLIDNPNRMA